MKRFEGIVSELPVMKKVAPAPVVKQEIEIVFARPSKNIISASNAVRVPQRTANVGTTTKKVKVINWKRFGLALAIAAFLIFIAIFGLVKAIGGQSSFEDNIEYIQMGVESGDTLWQLIRESNPEYNGDIRDLVYLAKKRNGSVNIMAGEMVEIPVYKK